MNNHVNIRQLLLDTIKERAQQRDSSLQSGSILNEIARKLNGGTELEQAMLTAWHDLFRNGILAWGHNACNPHPPFFHLTDIGRKTLANLSRDPSNPEGYMASLEGYIISGSIADSYISEALRAYVSSCHKSAAVMIGSASESLLYELRDKMVLKFEGKNCHRDLTDWRTKRVLDAIQSELDFRRRDMPSSLAERYESFWGAFTGHLRIARNDAGHPKSIAPVAEDVVHGSLLIFPELAKLLVDIGNWINSEDFKVSRKQSLDHPP